MGESDNPILYFKNLDLCKTINLSQKKLTQRSSSNSRLIQSYRKLDKKVWNTPKVSPGLPKVFLPNTRHISPILRNEFFSINPEESQDTPTFSKASENYSRFPSISKRDSKIGFKHRIKCKTRFSNLANRNLRP
mmetsp:Transcript_3104/g.4788  ORF Transcript_3104/g.4788 Transcript_3104/m.4788 type:complete len:134 (+) Transcript_3104:23-424(+)